MKKSKIDLPETTPPGRVSRRDFFGIAWKSLGILAVLEGLGMISAFIFTCKNKHGPVSTQMLDAGPVDSFELNTVSAFMGGRFYLARMSDGGFIALSLRCTHLGCSVSWEDNRKRFICPCHSSAFDISGEVLNPPAARALNYNPVLIENGIVKVDTGTLKERNSFRKDQLVYAQKA